MPKPINEQVVVVTGASSGIGRCAAKHLSAQGARVVVTARRRDALEDLVAAINRDGGQAIAVPGDVTSEDDLRTVSEVAVEHFGRIDTWVNNASVLIQGCVEDVTLEEVRRVVDVNLVGTINGTRCALDVMLDQESGVIVQVSSVAAQRAVPYLSTYSATKAGIAGFSEALRAELWDRGVSLSVLYPPTVDTPVYQHARGKLGVHPKPIQPVGDPEEAARAIAHLAQTGARAEYFFWARPIAWLNTLFPTAGDWLLHHIQRANWSDDPPNKDDNLDAPSTTVPAVTRGGWGEAGWRGLTPREVGRVLPWGAVVGGAALAVLAAVGGKWLFSD